MKITVYYNINESYISRCKGYGCLKYFFLLLYFPLILYYPSYISNEIVFIFSSFLHVK